MGKEGEEGRVRKERKKLNGTWQMIPLSILLGLGFIERESEKKTVPFPNLSHYCHLDLSVRTVNLRLCSLRPASALHI